MKITNIYELIQELRKKGLNENAAERESHPVLIGDMYEGLARNLVKESLFAQFDLRIAGGKIENSNGDRSKQIDCMIAIGDGRPYPNASQHRVYNAKDVVAVVEVKKTLYSKELAEALANVTSAASVLWTDPAVNPAAIHKGAVIKMHADAYRSVRHRPYPIAGRVQDGLTPQDEVIYKSLLLDSVLPLRIIWGFYGFKTSRKLREAYVDLLQQQSLPPWVVAPSLCICGDLSIVKANGMPFVQTQRTSATWDFLYSQRNVAIRNLVNILWYRLSRMYTEDFSLLSDGKQYSELPLVSLSIDTGGKPTLVPFDVGDAVEDESVEQPPPIYAISLEEFVGISLASLHPQHLVDTTQPLFLEKFLKACTECAEVLTLGAFPFQQRPPSRSVNELLGRLTSSGLFVREDSAVRLTTSNCLAWADTRGVFAGENLNGHLWAIAADTSKPLGPLPSFDASESGVFGAVRSIVESRLKRATRELSVELAVRFNQHFGSRAVQVDERIWIVEINSGTLAILGDVFNRCLAHREAFPKVGNAATEVIECPTLPTYFSDATLLEATRRACLVPADPERKQYAIDLHYLGVLVVWLRESLRVIRGYAGFIDSLASGAQQKPTNSELALMDYDVDALTVHHLVSSGFSLESVMVAIHTCNLLHPSMTRYPRLDEELRRARLNHVMLARAIVACAKPWFGVETDAAQALCLGAMRRTELAWALVTGQPNADDSMVAAFTDPETEVISDAWGSVRLDVAPFAYESLED